MRTVWKLAAAAAVVTLGAYLLGCPHSPVRRALKPLQSP